MNSSLVAILVAQLATDGGAPLPAPDGPHAVLAADGFLAAAPSPDAGGADGGTDAGTGWNAPLYEDCPKTDELAVQSEQGPWIVPDARIRRTACLMETCRAREEKFEDRVIEGAISLLPGWFIPTVAVLVGMLVGGLVGYAIGRAVGK